MKKLFLMIVALSSAVLLTACGGGSSEPVFGAAEDLSVAIDADTGATVVPAVANEQFVFSSVPDFGTQGSTTVVFTNTATTPAFSITAGGNTATGVTEFGSCRFRVTSSTFPASSPLAAGKTVVIANCKIRFGLRGVSADGAEEDRVVTLSLNNATSLPTVVTVTVSRNGTVRVNGRIVGRVPVRDLTGG